MRLVRLFRIFACFIMIFTVLAAVSACDAEGQSPEAAPGIDNDTPSPDEDGQSPSDEPGGNDPAPPQPDIITVVFDTGGGFPIEPVELFAGQSIEEAPFAFREDHVFEGWYLSPDFDETSAVEFPYEPSGDTVLFARWNEFYTEGLSFGLSDDERSYTVTGYVGDESDVVVPSEYFGLPVTAIGNYALTGKITRTISLPETLTTIEEHAFDACRNLSSIFIPSAVETIGDEAFSECSALTEITFEGNNVETIGARAFEYCSLLDSVTIPDSVYSLGDHAFFNCMSLRSVTLGENISIIERYTFRYCYDLVTVEMRGMVTAVYDYAFANCTALQEMTFGEGLLQIWPSAFKNCTSLYKVVLPASLAEIGSDAFKGCSSLGYAVFGAPDGWMREDILGNIVQIELGTPEENAVLLTKTHRAYMWHK